MLDPRNHSCTYAWRAETYIHGNVEEISVYTLNTLLSEGLGQDFPSSRLLYIGDLRFLIKVV
ncbi:MAG: hypothetical protein JSW19_00345 [Candidatus Bathyarchaeota archaeon]|nr:MAG: hypothetical protein JSW19_00345 [Candidatus Bathyarchaeota archaeon]